MMFIEKCKNAGLCEGLYSIIKSPQNMEIQRVYVCVREYNVCKY